MPAKTIKKCACAAIESSGRMHKAFSKEKCNFLGRITLKYLNETRLVDGWYVGDNPGKI